MNRELKVWRNKAEIVERGIERTCYLAEKYPESPVDYGKIMKAQINLLDAIHDVICDLVIKDIKTPFWKKLFLK